MLQRAEQHKLEGEARRRVDEVRELQKVCLASLLQMDCTCSSSSASSPALVAHGHAPVCIQTSFILVPMLQVARLLAVLQAFSTAQFLLLHSRRASI